MSNSGSTTRTVGSLGSSTDSGGGSFTKRKDFGNKQRKVVRILTVVAYIMSVSFVALLLSAYYVFVWEPEKSNPISHRRATESPSVAYHHYAASNNRLTSALHAQQLRIAKKAYKNTMMPTPQSLILERLLDNVTGRGTTTTPVRNPASAPDDPDAPHKRRTTPQEMADRPTPTTAATLLKMTTSTTTKPVTLTLRRNLGRLSKIHEQEEDVRHMITRREVSQ